MTKSSHLLICCQCCQSLQRPPPSVGGPCGERAHDEEGQHDGGLPATRRQCQLFLDDHHQPSGQQAGHGLCPGWDTQSGKRLVMTCQWRASLTHLIYLSWTWAFVPPPNTCFFSDSCWLIDFCCFGRETDPGAPLDSTNHNAHLAYPYTFLKLHTKKKNINWNIQIYFRNCHLMSNNLLHTNKGFHMCNWCKREARIWGPSHESAETLYLLGSFFFCCSVMQK